MTESKKERKACEWIAFVTKKSGETTLVVKASRKELSDEINSAEIEKIHNVWKAYPLNAKVKVVV